MRPLKIAILTTSIFLLSYIAQAQVGDWQDVENVPPGTPISVKLRFRVRCVFQRANGEQLVCERTQRVWTFANSSEIKVDRKHVREVRLEHSDSTNALVGAAVAGGGAATVVAARVDGDAKTRATAAVFAGSLFAFMGGVSGRDFPTCMARLFIAGRCCTWNPSAVACFKHPHGSAPRSSTTWSVSRPPPAFQIA